MGKKTSKKRIEVLPFNKTNKPKHSTFMDKIPLIELLKTYIEAKKVEIVRENMLRHFEIEERSLQLKEKEMDKKFEVLKSKLKVIEILLEKGELSETMVIEILKVLETI